MKYKKLSSEEKKARAEKRKQEKYNNEHEIINGVIYKICNKHKLFFPEESEWIISTSEYFYINQTNNIDGLHPCCIRCSIKDTQQWREENPEEYKALNHKTNTNPSEKTKEAFRINNKNRRENGKYQDWLNSNLERARKYQSDRQYKNHRMTEQEWIACKQFFNYQCAYCGLKIQNHFRKYAGKLQKIDLHKDHADYKGANDLSNCIPSCGSCNDKKWKFHLDYWYNKSNPQYTQERYNKIIKWLEEDYKNYIQLQIPKRKYNKKTIK